MDRSLFQAEVVTTGPLEGVDVHVGWAADEAGEGPHLLLMRGTHDEACCIVSGDAGTSATHYGGVVEVAVDDARTTVTLDPGAAVALGLQEAVVIMHRPGCVDADEIRRHLDQVLRQ